MKLTLNMVVSQFRMYCLICSYDDFLNEERSIIDKLYALLSSIIFKRHLETKLDSIFFLFGFDAKFSVNASNISSESGSTSICFLQIHSFVNCIGMMGFQLSFTNFVSSDVVDGVGGSCGSGGGGGGGSDSCGGGRVDDVETFVAGDKHSD